MTASGTGFPVFLLTSWTVTTFVFADGDRRLDQQFIVMMSARAMPAEPITAMPISAAQRARDVASSF
jgi:hypothetical protein